MFILRRVCNAHDRRRRRKSGETDLLLQVVFWPIPIGAAWPRKLIIRFRILPALMTVDYPNMRLRKTLSYSKHSSTGIYKKGIWLSFHLTICSFVVNAWDWAMHPWINVDFARLHLRQPPIRYDLEYYSIWKPIIWAIEHELIIIFRLHLFKSQKIKGWFG